MLGSCKVVGPGSSNPKLNCLLYHSACRSLKDHLCNTLPKQRRRHLTAQKSGSHPGLFPPSHARHATKLASPPDPPPMIPSPDHKTPCTAWCPHRCMHAGCPGTADCLLARPALLALTSHTSGPCSLVVVPEPTFGFQDSFLSWSLGWLCGFTCGPSAPNSARPLGWHQISTFPGAKVQILMSRVSPDSSSTPQPLPWRRTGLRTLAPPVHPPCRAPE